MLFCSLADEGGVVCIFYGSRQAEIVIFDVLENQFVKALDFFSTEMMVAALRPIYFLNVSNDMSWDVVRPSSLPHIHSHSFLENTTAYSPVK